MKALIKITLILIAIICIPFSCQTDNADLKTGIISKVYSGSGDCMPVVDYSRRTYNLYSGRVYIVQKQEYDKPDNTLESLKNKSMNIIIKNGELAVTLWPDSFVVFIDDGYNPDSNSNNVIYLRENDLVKTPFYFFRCTSY
jgi:hypothetical protein